MWALGGQKWSTAVPEWQAAYSNAAAAGYEQAGFGHAGMAHGQLHANGEYEQGTYQDAGYAQPEQATWTEGQQVQQGGAYTQPGYTAEDGHHSEHAAQGAEEQQPVIA